MIITIFDRYGNLKAEVSSNDSSTWSKEIQSDNVLSLSFTHHDFVLLDVDDYVDFDGERYWLCEKYRPKQKSTHEWEYNLKLYGIESLLKNILVIKRVDNEENPVFTLTAPPREHVSMIVNCLNNGMGNTSDWKVGQVDGTENVVIDYFGKYCDEALRELAEKVGVEYWVEGQTVNVCRCEHGDPIILGYDKGLDAIEPDRADNVKFYTRLYPIGSRRNIDPEKYGYSRLQLPDGEKYVEVNADKYGRVDHYEEAAFADIYPRRIGEISSVRSEVKTGEDGNPFTIYYFKDDSLPFDPNKYEIPGLVKRVSFQEGSELAGLGAEEDGSYYFEVNFNSDTREFEIITTWPYDDDSQLPGGSLIPKVHDRYILWHLRMPDEYYRLAEDEFRTAVDKYNKEHGLDITVFKASTDHVWIEDNNVDLFVGRRVRLESKEYFPETGYRDSRITKITRRVNLPSLMDLEIGDALSRSSKQKFNDDIADARSYARSIKGSVSLPDIIRVGDSTKPTDNNLYSARRVDRNFVSKVKDDRSKGKIASDLGFEVGKYLAGASGGMLGIDSESGESFADVFRLFVRGKAYFETLTIIEAKSLAGKQYITPGGSVKCSKVEEITNDAGAVTAYRCYFLSEQDGEKTETKIIAGDQAISEMFNAKTGTANKVSNHRYWRLVTAVNNDAYTDESGNHYGYIELSATDCENGSDTPQEGDVIDQFGNRTDPARQAAMVFDTVGPDAPSIKMYGGINSYTLNDRAIISFGRDPLNNKVYFRLGIPGASQYLDYKQGEGLTLAGKLSVNSTIDGKTLNDYFTDLIPELSQDDIEGFVNAIVDPKLEGIQNQIDGVIESLFGFGAPTLNNYPANEWTTDEVRKAHERDTYTDKTEYVDDATTPTAGQSWKWQYTSPTDYGWVKIADSDAVKALLDAAKAQDTADSKRRTFTAQPVPPYDKGDLWVNATYGTQYSNDILRCITAKASGAAFAIGDWTLASKYTDDTLAQAAKDAADAAQNAADAAQSSVDNLNTYVDGAFKDGIITAAEASGIANYINTVNTDKERIAATYATLSNNAYLPASAKAPLKSAYDAVMSAINALISAINSAIADNKITPAEATAVNNAFATFNTANGSFSTAVENADKAIQDVLKNAADAAKTAADNAQAAADAAKGVADAAKDRLDNWAADGVISPTEKQAIRDEMVRIAADKAHIDNEFARYGLTDNEIHTAYKGCYNTYLGQLQALASTAQENNTIPSDFENNQAAYYYTRTLSLALIAAEAKKYAEEVAKQEAQNAVAGYEYLKNALPQDTQIIGGLLMSTLISLGYTDAGNVRHTMAGINGAWVDALGGRTIGSWWGGPMVDLFDANDAKKNLAAGTYATSMVRMDGSAYFAGGNIGFRANGSGWLGNDLTGIKFDANGGMTFGSGVTFNVANVSGLKTTLDSLANFNLGLNRLLSPCNANGEEMPWEEAFQHDGSSDPNAIKAKSLKAKVDFWSTGGVSALGKSAGGSGGSGGGSFGLMKVWPTTDPGSGTTDALGANLGWELRQDVLSLKSGSALSVVTAGSGNAITDIVKSGTTVTATKGATFLTQHQPLDYLNVKDVRDAVRPPTYFGARRLSAWFNNTGTPSSTWYSGIHVRGWDGAYASWELAATSATSVNNKNLYFRVGINSTWEAWQKVLTDANYSSVLNGKFVTLDTAQTISGAKIFTAELKAAKKVTFLTEGRLKIWNVASTRNSLYGDEMVFVQTSIDGADPETLWPDKNRNDLFLQPKGGHVHIGPIETAQNNTLYVAGDIKATSGITASSFVKSGGTASQFLKADGSVDGNSYALASSLGSYYTKAEVDTKDKRLTTYYASRPTSANVNFGNNTGLYTFLATSSMTTGKPSNDSHILHMEWDNSLSWAAQLAIPASDGSNMQWRGQNGTEWRAWRTLLDTNNYAYILDGRYYTESEIDSKLTDGSVTKVGTATVGSSARAIYLNGGVPTACTYWFGNASGNAALNNGILNSNLNADMVDGKHNGELSAKTLAVANPTTVGVTVATAKANLLNTVKGSVFGNVAKAGQDLIGNWDNDSHTTIGSSAYSVINVTPQYDGSSYGQYLLFHYGAYNPVIIGRQNGAWTSVKTLAFTSDNVASATKLATARTINGTNFDGTANIVTSYWGATRTLWGQSCNGSGNVSGDMAGVGTIYNSANSAPYLKIASAPTNAGNLGTAIGLGSAPDNYGLFIWGEGTGKGHIQVGRKDGTQVAYSLILQEFGGNVGIGTTSPAYKLDVSGQIKANVATGTAPFVTPSTTLCTNLNADLLDGNHETSFVRSWWTSNPGYDCATHNTRPLISFTYSNNAPFAGAFIDIVTNGYGFYLGTQYGGDGPLYYRRHGVSGDGGMGSWQQLARITDNVASATKLQTARTIWGQSFNGTANVSGALTGVTDITASGDIKAKRLSFNNGASYMEWDAANNAFKVNGNFYATGGSSCLGFNYFSATEVSVGTLNADIVKGDALAIGGYGLIMASDDVLGIAHSGGGNIAFGTTIQAYEGIVLGDGSYTIDEVGVASLSDVSVVKLTINNAVFTVSGNEIYVTIGSTRYKLTKTTA